MAKKPEEIIGNDVEKTTEVVKDDAYYNEKVTIKLFKDNGKYKDDVFVAVNGVGMIVPRGKEVEIPRKYALAIDNSERQDKHAVAIQEEYKKNI